MKAIWIKNGKVENVSLWDENSTIPDGETIILKDDSFYVGIGFLYDGENFTQPSEEQAG